MAQKGIYVFAIDNKEPLPQANAVNPQDQHVFVADKNGFIDLSAVKSTINLFISYVGYHSKSIQWTPEQNTENIFLQPDYKVLENIVVTGHDNNRKLTEIASSYGIISSQDISRYNDKSLVAAVNTLPGVRMEERSPGSYRVSIRGSLLRAPYGVRNIKVYWNEIPFTDPTGTTPLNLLDVNNLGKMEIIKGPAGSIYGAGMGGVLIFNSEKTPFHKLSGDFGTVVGSFGYRKAYANLNTGGEDHRLSLRYSKQTSDGYREHTNFDLETIQLQSQIFSSEKRTISIQAIYSDLFYQLPGGLTKAQFDENPRQARAASVAQNALIDQRNFLAGISQDYRWNDKTGNVTSLYLSNGLKENPFITNYELEKLKGYGGRTRFYRNTTIAGLPSKITLGGEVQYGLFHAASYGIDGGYADTLRYEDELKSWQAFTFAQLESNLGKNWIFTAGASLNYLRYDIHRLKDAATGNSYSLNRVFNPVVSPRVGIVRKINDEISSYISVSSGFSPPSTEEVRTSDGGINDQLEAERGINYEIGIRGNAVKKNLMFDISIFNMQQQQTIVSRILEGGNSTFENAGSTAQKGFEALIGYNFLYKTTGIFNLLLIKTAFTCNDFKFKNYIKESGGKNVDYSGNALTGTSPIISVTTLDVGTRSGIYANFTYNYTDRIPLDDANTAYANSYQLISAKLGFKCQFHHKLLLDIFTGVDNLLNEKYSLGNDLNAFGNRYYNPAPERNYFAGLRLMFNEI